MAATVAELLAASTEASPNKRRRLGNPSSIELERATAKSKVYSLICLSLLPSYELFLLLLDGKAGSESWNIFDKPGIPLRTLTKPQGVGWVLN